MSSNSGLEHHEELPRHGLGIGLPRRARPRDASERLAAGATGCELQHVDGVVDRDDTRQTEAGRRGPVRLPRLTPLASRISPLACPLASRISTDQAVAPCALSAHTVSSASASSMCTATSDSSGTSLRQAKRPKWTRSAYDITVTFTPMPSAMGPIG